MMTGPTILTPITLTFGAPARALSASKIQRCAGVQSGPPYSTGHPGAPQPFLCSAFCQAMPMSGSENTEGVSDCACFTSGGQILRDEVADFLLEGALFRAEGEIHVALLLGLNGLRPPRAA